MRASSVLVLWLIFSLSLSAQEGAIRVIRRVSAPSGWGSSPVQTSGENFGNAASCNPTFSGSTTVGNTIIIAVVETQGAIGTVTDNGSTSNTYTATGSLWAAFGVDIIFYSAPVVHTSTVTTATWTGSGIFACKAWEWHGGASAPNDSQGGCYAGLGAPCPGSGTTSNTQALAQAVGNELFFAVNSVNGGPAQTLTTTGGWVDCTINPGGTGIGIIGCGYLVSTDSATKTAVWNWSGSTFWTNLIANFKHQ